MSGVQMQTPAPKVNLRAGEMRGDVSAQWASRPDDQRFLSIQALRGFVHKAAEESTETVIDACDIEIADVPTEDGGTLEIALPGGTQVDPTHWAFDQLCGLAKAPANYMRRLPAPLAAINLQHGLLTREDPVMAYTRENGATELRAITSPDYGRIRDVEIVDAVNAVAELGDWKVPGVIDWASMSYNAHAEVTKQSTTLYASDRDVFMFLVDDLRPIEVGRLDNGDPDLMFRGFYAWNSEVGSKTAGFATMYLRGVCQNRCLWGVEEFNEVTIRHTKNAPDRFLCEAQPALETFATGAGSKLIEHVTAAKNLKLADDDEEAVELLTDRLNFTKGQAKNVLLVFFNTDGHPARTAWDFAQGITAAARDVTHQDDRVAFERRANKLMDRVAA